MNYKKFQIVTIAFFVGIVMFMIGIGIKSPNDSESQLTQISSKPDSQYKDKEDRIRKLALALANYESVHGDLPPVHSEDVPDVPNENGFYPHSWRVYILPFIGEKKLFDEIRLNEPWDSEWNKRQWDKMPEIFADPNLDLKNQNKETSYCLLLPLMSRSQRTIDIKTLQTSDKETQQTTDEKTLQTKYKENLKTIVEGRHRTVLIAESQPDKWMDPNHDIHEIRGKDTFRSTMGNVYVFGMYDFSIQTLDGSKLKQNWEKIINREYDFGGLDDNDTELAPDTAPTTDPPVEPAETPVTDPAVDIPPPPKSSAS